LKKELLSVLALWNNKQNLGLARFLRNRQNYCLNKRFPNAKKIPPMNTKDATTSVFQFF